MAHQAGERAASRGCRSTRACCAGLHRSLPCCPQPRSRSWHDHCGGGCDALQPPGLVREQRVGGAVVWLGSRGAAGGTAGRHNGSMLQSGWWCRSSWTLAAGAAVLQSIAAGPQPHHQPHHPPTHPPPLPPTPLQLPRAPHQLPGQGAGHCTPARHARGWRPLHRLHWRPSGARGKNAAASFSWECGATSHASSAGPACSCRLTRPAACLAPPHPPASAAGAPAVLPNEACGPLCGGGQEWMAPHC